MISLATVIVVSLGSSRNASSTLVEKKRCVTTLITAAKETTVIGKTKLT